ncbi:MAG: polysaccharide biosynthesis tyrosine autokinase, partial [Cyclobacteriaceae bacterium]|nr:polysaccharide biosynthesis tyrosine autokinase [Cyclobacteriaceae bacterium]
DALETQRADLLIRQNYLNYLENYMNQEGARLDQIILPASMGINDAILNSLVQQMIALQTDVRLFSSPEKGSNPLIEAKAARIREIKREIESGIKSLRTTDKIKMDYINNQLKALQEQLNNLPSSERQLIAVQRNYALLENLYVFLMQKLSEAAITRAANTSDIILVNPPAAGAPIYPKPSQNYTIALVLGLFIPFGIFILFELLNNKVQSKEDIEKMTTIPFIGGVGHNTSGGNLTVKERPKSGVAESFRALRSNLNYFTGNKSKQVYMITSSISGEGKTFTTINLATVFALSGKKTLIVGADMRRPKIFEDFKCSNDIGLSTYLSGLHSFEQIIQKTEIENLYLISGGPVPPNPSELLLTDKFSEFIKKSVEQFDFVIIDTPPLALVTDAFVISKFADHTVFVLRQNFSPKQLSL